MIFSRKEGANAFLAGLIVGYPTSSQPYSGTQRSPRVRPLPRAPGQHLFWWRKVRRSPCGLNGESYATLNAVLLRLTAPCSWGQTDGRGFAGEVDELEISVCCPSGWFSKGAAMLDRRGRNRRTKLLQVGTDEESGQTGGGRRWSYARAPGACSATSRRTRCSTDGCVIFACLIMALVGWTVAPRKFFYLNRIQKGGR